MSWAKKILIGLGVLFIGLGAVVVVTYSSGYETSEPMLWVYEHNDLRPGSKAMADLMVLIQEDRLANQDHVRNPGLVKTIVRKFYQSDESMLRDADFRLSEGELDKAIGLAEDVLAGKEKGSDLYMRAMEYIAVGYLRKGEQENCITGHNANSCLLPIAGSGVYELQDNTRRAISIYEQLLEISPDDWRYKWIINVAYQTIGEYPDNVPEKWLIQSSLLEDNDPSDNFVDLGPDLGLSALTRAGGALMDDFNNDGFLDIAFSDMYYKSIQIYMNNGKDGFVDKTKEAGLEGHSAIFNMEQFDYNNDGHLDILGVRGSWQRARGMYPNSLLRNNGDGTFTDVTVEAGLLSFKPTSGSVVADFNNDGWTDIFIGNESATNGDLLFPSELYINQHDGTFKEVAQQVGLDFLAFVKGQAAGDYNNDGLMDLFISNYRGDNFLFKNEGMDEQGLPRFTDVSKEAGITDVHDSFTSWFWDYNNDGFLDLFVSEHQLGRGKTAADAAEHYATGTSDQVATGFYRNNGDGTFTNIRTEVGLTMPLHTMGANFGDINNDGYPDFYIGTGEPDYMGIPPNRLLQNVNGESFDDVSSEKGVAHIQKGHGIAFGDLDNDGDQDMLLESGGTVIGDPFQNSVFRNPGNENNWVTLKLQGTTSSRDAIGTRVKLVVKNGSESRHIYTRVCSGGHFGSNSLQLEIGLGKSAKIESMEIDWPNSEQPEIFTKVAVNQRYHIVEGKMTLIEMNQPVVEFVAVEQEMDHSHH